MTTKHAILPSTSFTVKPHKVERSAIFVFKSYFILFKLNSLSKRTLHVSQKGWRLGILAQ